MRNTMPKTVALLAGSALLAAGTAHADRSEWPTNFTVGTASQGGTYFVYGSGWANFIAEELDVSGGGEVTGGPMQNMALVHTGEAVIAIGGAYGTLSEIGHALSDGIPVIGLKTWPLTTNGDGTDIAGAIIQAESPSDAVDKALAAVAASNHRH